MVAYEEKMYFTIFLSITISLIFSETSREESTSATSSDINNNTIEQIVRSGIQEINSKIEFGLSKFHSYFLEIKEEVKVIKNLLNLVIKKEESSRTSMIASYLPYQWIPRKS